jgi:flavodoxin
MKTALLYASNYGKTRKVVEQAIKRLSANPEVFDVKTPPGLEQIAQYDIILFFSPTYGDGELQSDMEEFICRLNLDLTGKVFVVCELGGYNGYEIFSFGTAVILRKCLFERGAKELYQPLSLDSLPHIHWPHFYNWIEEVNRAINSYVRH